jgi:GT2 family glycosyltransferase
VKDSVILTVYNRDITIMLNTLVSLRKNNLEEDTEVLFVDDGSTEDYEDLIEMAQEWAGYPLRYLRAPEYEAYRINGGHNNPAIVNNWALTQAQGERIFFLSSDVMLPPHAMDAARAWVDRGAIYTPRTLDMDSGNVYCGRDRPYPMMWFVGCRKADIDAIGGFDEKFCEGMAFEDNDFMGRLFQHVGKLIIDLAVTAFHQSHAQVYTQDEGVGYLKSKKYCLAKHDGVPFADDWRVKFKTANVGNTLILTMPPVGQPDGVAPKGVTA